MNTLQIFYHFLKSHNSYSPPKSLLLFVIFNNLAFLFCICNILAFIWVSKRLNLDSEWLNLFLFCIRNLPPMDHTRWDPSYWESCAMMCILFNRSIVNFQINNFQNNSESRASQEIVYTFTLLCVIGVGGCTPTPDRTTCRK